MSLKLLFAGGVIGYKIQGVSVVKNSFKLKLFYVNSPLVFYLTADMTEDSGII